MNARAPPWRPGAPETPRGVQGLRAFRCDIRLRSDVLEETPHFEDWPALIALPRRWGERVADGADQQRKAEQCFHRRPQHDPTTLGAIIG